MITKGFQLIESLIATFILSIALPSLFVLFSGLFNALYHLEHRLFVLSDTLFTEALIRNDLSHHDPPILSNNTILLSGTPSIFYGVKNNRLFRQPLKQSRRYLTHYLKTTNISLLQTTNCINLTTDFNPIIICDEAP